MFKVVQNVISDDVCPYDDIRANQTMDRYNQLMYWNWFQFHILSLIQDLTHISPHYWKRMVFNDVMLAGKGMAIWIQAAFAIPGKHVLEEPDMSMS